MNDDKVVADLWAVESRLSASLEQPATACARPLLSVAPQARAQLLSLSSPPPPTPGPPAKAYPPCGVRRCPNRFLCAANSPRTAVRPLSRIAVLTRVFLGVCPTLRGGGWGAYSDVLPPPPPWRRTFFWGTGAKGARRKNARMRKMREKFFFLLLGRWVGGWAASNSPPPRPPPPPPPVGVGHFWVPAPIEEDVGVCVPVGGRGGGPVHNPCMHFLASKAQKSRSPRKGCWIRATQARIYGYTPYTPPFWEDSHTVPHVALSECRRGAGGVAECRR